MNSTGSQHSPEQFRVALEACVPALRARALKLCLDGHVARDLVQDTVERALRFESSYRPGTNLRAWAQQVLFSVFVTRCRKSRRERRALDGFAADPNSWTHRSSTVVSPSLSPRVRRALEALPEKYRRVIELVDICDFSYREAAEVLEVPVGTIMSRLFRARRQLAPSLADGYVGDASLQREAA